MVVDLEEDSVAVDSVVDLVVDWEEDLEEGSGEDLEVEDSEETVLHTPQDEYHYNLTATRVHCRVLPYNL